MSRSEKTAPVLVMVQADPPPKGSTQRISERLIEAKVPEVLKANAGVWYKVLQYSPNSTGTETRKRLESQMPEFEWVSRKECVYGRYVNGQGNG